MKSAVKKKSLGYTLLEYAVGAALILGIVYVGVNAMGKGVNQLLVNVGNWAADVTPTQVPAKPPSSPSN